MFPVGNMFGVYQSILKERGLWDKIKQEEAILKWSEIAGEKIASKSKAVKINKGILWIRVKDSVWLHHLSMMKVQIRDKFNKFLEGNLVKDVYFFVGEIENDGLAEEKSDLSLGKEEEKERLFEESEINDILRLIDDDNLRKIVGKILQNY